MVPKLFEIFAELEFGFFLFTFPLGPVCMSFKKSKLIFKMESLSICYGRNTDLTSRIRPKNMNEAMTGGIF